MFGSTTAMTSVAATTTSLLSSPASTTVHVGVAAPQQGKVEKSEGLSFDKTNEDYESFEP